MTKVHPNVGAAGTESGGALTAAGRPQQKPVENSGCDSVVLTVWKKSLLLNCEGFTVFDARGNLVFRVDNYVAAGTKVDTVLMDASGKSLLTIRRRNRLSLLAESWLVFDGETAVNPRYWARKNPAARLLNSKCLARVSSKWNGTTRSTSSSLPAPIENQYKNSDVVYEIEGSYERRCCAVYDDRRTLVAEIKRKEAAAKGVDFGVDVFRLIVHPQIDSAVAMALVILLDQMFGSSSSTPFSA